MEYHFVTFSDGSRVLTSSLPGVASMGVLAEGGVQEVSRIDLPDMTQEEFTALVSQTADHTLRYDEATHRIVATPNER